MKVLITGIAGFIGYHLAEHLIAQGHDLVGIDNINDYYSTELKFSRLSNLGIDINNSHDFGIETISSTYHHKLIFIKLNLEDKGGLEIIFKKYNFDVVCNLAAQAGVRYSISHPIKYVKSNILGFSNLIELCKQFKIKRLVYASSSSVYGESKNIPFNEQQNVSKPISVYAASKISNENIAHTYSHLYEMETIGLRFFTVYGPWGRPDMALFLFTKAIIEKKPIEVYNSGNLFRDFTYIDDIIEGLKNTIVNDTNSTDLHRIYNIGRGKSMKLLDFIKAIENELGIKSEMRFLPKQPGDVFQTYSDCTKLKIDYNYTPKTDLDFGVKMFIKWYKSYYEII